jgi:hypothetical protein
MVFTRFRTTSARRVTGGVGLTVEPTTLASPSAHVSQFEMVLGQIRKVRAASSVFQAQ